MTILETLRERRDELHAELEEMKENSLSWTSSEIDLYLRRKRALVALESDIAFFEEHAQMAHAQVESSNGNRRWTKRQRQRKGQASWQSSS